MNNQFDRNVVTDIIPHHKIFSFLNELNNDNYRLLGYDFFIIIPGKSTMPSMTFDQDFSDSKLSNLELIALTFLDIFDVEKLKNYLTKSIQESNSDRYIEIYTEALKYLNGEETESYIGYEFVYQK